MSQFHQKFPFGKSAFIWELPSCLDGSVPAIIQKLKDNNVPNVIVKCADGKNTWDQFNQDLVDAFHAGGIKIYAWSYVYGVDPVREGDIALWALDLGADGFIFDAESEYEKLPNPGQTATTMLQTIRAKHPEAFLAHAPYPVVSAHPRFPYKEFGKFCNAVMPQVYQGEWQMNSQDAVIRMYNEWVAWQRAMESSGNQDCIQPLIPIMQTYDDYVLTPPYVLSVKDITEFIIAVSGYKAVAFWSFQHIVRGESWDAIKNNDVMLPTNEDLGLPASPNQTPPNAGAKVTETPTTIVNSVIIQSPSTTQNPSLNQTKGADRGIQNPDTDTQKILVDTVTVPTGGKVSIKNDPSSPTGVSVQVHHKVLLDYMIDFFKWMFKGGGK